MPSNPNFLPNNLSQHHHMNAPWQQYLQDEEGPANQASLKARTALVARIGRLLLAGGTGAWQVRDSMNTVAQVLGLAVTADIGLTTITLTGFDGPESDSQTIALANTGVNTAQLDDVENFVAHFNQETAQESLHQIHRDLDQLQAVSHHYPAWAVSLAAGLACAGFIFLLGGSWSEMLGCFGGASVGNYVRRRLIDHHLTTVINTGLGVAAACLTYFLIFTGLRLGWQINPRHSAGYIGAMLFVIPGFPFITSMLDIAKLDMRSGLERLTYALLITLSATSVGWLVASLTGLHPANFLPQGLGLLPLIIIHLLASFAGVYGFSVMFNSPQKMAITAGFVGAIANTCRLELINLGQVPGAAAALIGALIAGILASAVNHCTGFPRIALTVPAIVIMIPGLYIYRGIYNLGFNQVGTGAYWLAQAGLIILMLPLGLLVARVLFDKRWRYVD
ncbi:threonine/serine exporter family protein [Lactobacillaceae bacterium L1_55_11]|nr:threonine/serine exporter family protein [Lactobacillaceae bacterium L1_55_11]